MGQRFDYFQESASRSGSVPSHMAGSTDLEPPPPRVARFVATSVFASIFIGMVVWFAAGNADLVAFAFSGVREPLRLGDATELTPAHIPHNVYVTVHGITEHRGLRQQLVRGVSMRRENYWYFRLLGSRGVFLEVPPQKNLYGPTTEVTVTGRAVDPARSQTYATLLRQYSDIFHVEERDTMRVIQVGVHPGDGKWALLAVGLLLLGVALANAFAVGRAALRLRTEFSAARRPVE